jgi:hypothetical protein
VAQAALRGFVEHHLRGVPAAAQPTVGDAVRQVN